MACGFCEITNIVLLAVLVTPTLVYDWPSPKSLTFSIDLARMSLIVGFYTSAISLVIFSVMLCYSASPLAYACCVGAVIDVVCYAIWVFEGEVDMICTGAALTIGEVSSSASQYINCDVSWMKYVLWALVSLSGSFQLSVAYRAASSGGGSSTSNELGRSYRFSRNNSSRQRRERLLQNGDGGEEAQHLRSSEAVDMEDSEGLSTYEEDEDDAARKAERKCGSSRRSSGFGTLPDEEAELGRGVSMGGGGLVEKSNLSDEEVGSAR
ncbi:hypothetical protein JCM5296_000417 [Sporobolomyces johnsonii]